MEVQENLYSNIASPIGDYVTGGGRTNLELVGIQGDIDTVHLYEGNGFAGLNIKDSQNLGLLLMDTSARIVGSSVDYVDAGTDDVYVLMEDCKVLMNFSAYNVKYLRLDNVQTYLDTESSEVQGYYTFYLDDMLEPAGELINYPDYSPTEEVILSYAQTNLHLEKDAEIVIRNSTLPNLTVHADGVEVDGRVSISNSRILQNLLIAGDYDGQITLTLDNCEMDILDILNTSQLGSEVYYYGVDNAEVTLNITNSDIEVFDIVPDAYRGSIQGVGQAHPVTYNITNSNITLAELPYNSDGVIVGYDPYGMTGDVSGIKSFNLIDSDLTVHQQYSEAPSRIAHQIFHADDLNIEGSTLKVIDNTSLELYSTGQLNINDSTIESDGKLVIGYSGKGEDSYISNSSFSAGSATEIDFGNNLFDLGLGNVHNLPEDEIPKLYINDNTFELSAIGTSSPIGGLGVTEAYDYDTSEYGYYVWGYLDEIHTDLIEFNYNDFQLENVTEFSGYSYDPLNLPPPIYYLLNNKIITEGVDTTAGSAIDYDKYSIEITNLEEVDLEKLIEDNPEIRIRDGLLIVPNTTEPTTILFKAKEGRFLPTELEVEYEGRNTKNHTVVFERDMTGVTTVTPEVRPAETITPEVEPVTPDRDIDSFIPLRPTLPEADKDEPTEKPPISTGGGGGSSKPKTKIDLVIETNLLNYDLYVVNTSTNEVVKDSKGNEEPVVTLENIDAGSYDIRITGEDFNILQKRVIANEDTYVTLFAEVEGEDLKPTPIPDFLYEVENHVQYIHGYTDGTFKPDNNIKFSEVYSILYKLYNTDSSYRAPEKYGDVWYSNAKGWCAEVLGIVVGPHKDNDYVTREQLANFLGHLLIEVDEEYPDYFSDTDNQTVERFKSIGIINGYEDGTFRPDEYISRAEVVTLINNISKRPDFDSSTGSVIFSDVPKSHWAVNEIFSAATNLEEGETNPD